MLTPRRGFTRPHQNIENNPMQSSRWPGVTFTSFPNSLDASGKSTAQSHHPRSPRPGPSRARVASLTPPPQPSPASGIGGALRRADRLMSTNAFDMKALMAKAPRHRRSAPSPACGEGWGGGACGNGSGDCFEHHYTRPLRLAKSTRAALFSRFALLNRPLRGTVLPLNRILYCWCRFAGYGNKPPSQ